MRLLNYDRNGVETAALQLGEGQDLFDLADLAVAAGLDEDRRPRTTLQFLEGGVELAAVLGDALRESGPRLAEQGRGHARDDVRLLPPVTAPEKIICMGLNYHDHKDEVGAPTPASPLWFAKFKNSLIGPGASIVPPRTTEKVDWEGELAVVIGKACFDVPVSEALGYVAGAAPFNDVSARDLQHANRLWTSGKAIDTFAPFGPALVLSDELGDLQSLPVRTFVNGDLVQDGTTAKMIFGVAETISFLSTTMTLVPGDIIATGTPAGVGAAMKPQRWLVAGDEVTVEIGGLGSITNPVVDARPVGG